MRVDNVMGSHGTGNLCNHQFIKERVFDILAKQAEEELARTLSDLRKSLDKIQD